MPTPDDTDLPSPDDPEVQTVIDRFGGLAAVDTAQRIVAERRNDTTDSDTGNGTIGIEDCELCGETEATDFGVLVVNARAYPACALCEDCHVPIEELSLPRDVDRDQFIKMHEQLVESKTIPT